MHTHTTDQRLGGDVPSVPSRWSVAFVVSSPLWVRFWVVCRCLHLDGLAYEWTPLRVSLVMDDVIMVGSTSKFGRVTR